MKAMEPHKTIFGIDTQPDLNAGPEAYFTVAIDFVNRNYAEEVKRISSIDSNSIDDIFFFREYVWVVYATGFSAKAVSKFILKLLDVYGSWRTLSQKPFNEVMDSVKGICKNRQKAKAVHSMSIIMYEGMKSCTWSEWKKGSISSPKLLTKLPYIGSITCFHLARNIGMLDCVKPDLHLVRLAKHWGFNDCTDMCAHIQRFHREKTGEHLPLGIIDLYLWYTASSFSTIGIRKPENR